MTDTENLLSDTRTTLARWPDVRAGFMVSDEHGNIGFKATHGDGTRLLCTAKEEFWNGLASFMPRLVEQARREDRALVEFGGFPPTLDTGYAFDPETVRASGELENGKSPKGVAVEWYELDVEQFGVTLGRFLHEGVGLVPPVESPAGQATLEVKS